MENVFTLLREKMAQREVVQVAPRSEILDAVDARKKQRISDKNRKYKNDHPEKVVEYRKTYYKKNKETIGKKRDNFRKEHPEKVKEQNRKYYQAHKEEKKKKATEYRTMKKAENPDLFRQRDNARQRRYRDELRKNHPEKYAAMLERKNARRRNKPKENI